MITAAVLPLALGLPHPPSESEVTRVPLDPVAGLILFETSVAGSEPVTFLLDSGASGVVIDTALAERLELERGREHTERGAVEGSRVTLSFVERVPFRVGGAEFVARNAAVADVSPICRAMIGIECAGIIGHPFFEQFTVEIDYVENEMILHRPAEHVANPVATVVPLEFDAQVGGLPFTRVQVDNGRDGFTDVRMLVDSGGNLYATGSLGSSADIDALVPPDLPVYEGQGATGLGSSPENVMHKSYVARFPSLRWQGHRIEAPLIGWSTRSVRFGVLGAQLLSRFDVVFDYRNARLLITPNERYGDPIVHDASGLMVVADAGDADVRRISHVSPGSPAEEIGLEAGDEILGLNGRPAARLGLTATRALFTQPGEYELRVRRGEETFTRVLKARRLL